LVSDPGQGADHNYRLRAEPTLHDANQAPDGGSIFHRRASKLHHHHIVASLKSALSL
jgi:hypothetical protein